MQTELLMSRLLVVFQMVLIAWLIWPGAGVGWSPVGIALMAAGFVLGAWSLAVNRPGNFRIMPEVKRGATLVQSGPYRWMRHPMYIAVLLGTLGCLVCQISIMNLFVWLGLAVVLAVKAAREERLLSLQFPEYGDYRASMGTVGPLWVSATGLVLTVFMLRMEGRIWWCACGGYKLWDGDIWSSHNSQHVFDPYSFTHVLHGMLFFWILAGLLPRLKPGWRLSLAVLLESSWEVLENSPFIIQRYREATIGQGYVGDSVINSLADILCCVAGFVLARRLGWRWALAVFVLVEVVLAVVVRDNLTLNILMLICPVDAIKQWQMVH